MRHLDYLWAQLGRYVAAVETFITQSDAALPLSDAEKTKLRQQPEIELEMPVGYEELIEATEVFPHTLRRSTLILILTLLENVLDELCEALQRWSKNPISVYDMRGQGIQRAAEYIRLVAGAVASQSPFWQGIRELHHIRNVLVHANGRVRSTQLDGPAARVAKSHPLIELVPAAGEGESSASDHVIIVKAGLCERVVEETSQFLRSLLRALEEKGVKV